MVDRTGKEGGGMPIGPRKVLGVKTHKKSTFEYITNLNQFTKKNTGNFQNMPNTVLNENYKLV